MSDFSTTPDAGRAHAGRDSSSVGRTGEAESDAAPAVASASLPSTLLGDAAASRVAGKDDTVTGSAAVHHKGGSADPTEGAAARQDPLTATAPEGEVANLPEEMLSGASDQTGHTAGGGASSDAAGGSTTAGAEAASRARHGTAGGGLPTGQSSRRGSVADFSMGRLRRCMRAERQCVVLCRSTSRTHRSYCYATIRI